VSVVAFITSLPEEAPKPAFNPMAMYVEAITKMEKAKWVPSLAGVDKGGVLVPEEKDFDGIEALNELSQAVVRRYIRKAGSDPKRGDKVDTAISKRDGSVSAKVPATDDSQVGKMTRIYQGKK
jgi:hypothetical protein